MQNKHTGIILWFNLAKDLGIIRPNQIDEDDLYFNMASLVDRKDQNLLASGTLVEYSCEQTFIGIYASKVCVSTLQ
jgi:cold shock CspA family protein